MLRAFSLLVAAVALAGPAVAASPDDAAINAVYARLSAARAAGDVAGMAGGFAPDALLIDARPGPALAGAELAGRVAPQAQRLRDEGVRFESRYRVERRSVMGEIAVDAGFMRQSLTRAGGPPQVRVARFLVTLRREADGWRIIADASMPATEEAWSGVAPVDGLQYD